MRDSLIVGAGTGAAIGAVAGAQMSGDRSENTLKGLVIGGVVGGLASYLIHNSLESRDTRVRRETLLNLEKYDVMGRGDLGASQGLESDGKCFTSQSVDGRVVSVPCRFVNEAPK